MPLTFTKGVPYDRVTRAFGLAVDHLEDMAIEADAEADPEAAQQYREEASAMRRTLENVRRYSQAGTLGS